MERKIENRDCSELGIMKGKMDLQLLTLWSQQSTIFQSPDTINKKRGPIQGPSSLYVPCGSLQSQLCTGKGSLSPSFSIIMD